MSLRGLLTYPLVEVVDDRLLLEALAKVGLDGQLDDEQEWERVFSGGISNG